MLDLAATLATSVTTHRGQSSTNGGMDRLLKCLWATPKVQEVKASIDQICKITPEQVNTLARCWKKTSSSTPRNRYAMTYSKH